MNYTDIILDECNKDNQRIGGNIYDLPKPSLKMDFSSNSNVLRTPYNLLKNIKRCSIYARPDLSYKKAIQNLCNTHSVSKENITVGKSNYELIATIIRALRIRSATVVMPCEPEYKSICRQNFCDVIPYIMNERHNYKLDCDDFIDNITSKSDAIIISNPNNATGRLVSEDNMKLIFDYCQSKGIYVIVDEAFIDFVLNAKSAISSIFDYRNVIVLRSPAEYYGTLGINAAYAVACDEIIEIINKIQPMWCIDSHADALLQNAYKYEKFDIKTKKWIFEEKQRFVKKLKKTESLRIINTDCHYMLISLGEVSATSVYKRLLKSNILIRDASDFNGLDGSYIRISIRDKKSNDILSDELLRCLI